MVQPELAILAPSLDLILAAWACAQARSRHWILPHDVMRPALVRA